MLNLPDKENTSIVGYRFDLEIIEGVIHQLEKDVLLSGGTIVIPAIAYQDIFILKEVVSAYINDIAVSNTPLLLNLFYRIDIPQDTLAYTPMEISDQVLKRELVKVLLRKFYGK